MCIFIIGLSESCALSTTPTVCGCYSEAFSNFMSKLLESSCIKSATNDVLRSVRIVSGM